MDVGFEVVGRIAETETIAIGGSIRELPQSQACSGRDQWRKRKGVANVRLSDGTIRLAEVHWYEAHGTGKVRMKIKQYVD